MNRRLIGRILILLGASVWVPYFALKLSGAQVEITPFLAVHLAMVIPGAILAPGDTVYSRITRWLDRNQDKSKTS